MRSELEEKQEVMHSLQETADRLCQENHPAKQTVEVRLPSNRAIKAVQWPFKTIGFPSTVLISTNSGAIDVPLQIRLSVHFVLNV